MVYAAVDVETYEKKGDRYVPVLNANKFFCAYYKEENQDGYFFTDKKKLKSFIIKRALQFAKQRQKLNIYAHNHFYDIVSYIGFDDPNLTLFCESPFIGSYKVDKVEIIKFLDSFSFFKGSAEKMGQLIGKFKLDMPKAVKNAEQIFPYVKRDVEIVLDFVLYLRDKLYEDGIKLKRLYTIHQIAIQYFLHLLKKEECDFFFFNKERNQTHFTKQEGRIHEAYRGGRVDCFKLGKHKKVHHIDVNSLYPSMAYKMNFPDLRTQKFIEYPSKPFTPGKVGVSRCLIFNATNDIGLLPVTGTDFSHFPKANSFLIGTWTYDELEVAVKEGYKILACEWTIYYDLSKINPYKKIVPYLYNKRMNSETDFDNYFYKSILNSHIGKLAQKRTNLELTIQDIDTALLWAESGYDMVKGINDTRLVMLKKVHTRSYQKPYYAPMIPTIINAMARIFMYKQFVKIGKDDLLYTDTDSVFFTGDHIKKFTISNQFGDFKLEHYNSDMLIWGKKTYSIDEDIKISGIHSKDLKIDDFRKGLIKSQQMIKLGSSSDIKEYGTFKPIVRDLSEVSSRFTEIKNKLDTLDIFIDIYVRDVSFFKPFLEKYM